MKISPGQTLLHYRLIEKIGEGGMGVVWKAIDTTLGREVAIKVLPEALATDAERMARFEREAMLLGSLNHPNIATVYGLHEAEGTRFIAMEFVPGEDLSQRLAGGAMPLDEAREVAGQIAAAGAFEIVLADTIGSAAPNDIAAVVAAVRARLGDEVELGLHLHDTRGLALANATAGLDVGVRRFDASVGGLGGCPFSPGATGNVCTEDLVHLFHALGLTTGVDLDELMAVAAMVEHRLGTELPSRMLRAGPRFAHLAT